MTDPLSGTGNLVNPRGPFVCHKVHAFIVALQEACDDVDNDDGGQDTSE